MPLPIVPPPFRDERLSSWLERIADVYLVSLDELQAHVGWSRFALQLEREPVQADFECIAAATNNSVERLSAMTFQDAPSRYRRLLRSGSRESCPFCSRGLPRPQRLKGWSFAFTFWCDRHNQPLFGSEMRGVGTLGDEASARRGSEILHHWATGRDRSVVPVRSVLSLLLLPLRRASPPAPWELARLPLKRQHDPTIRSRPRRRPVLIVVVPEFTHAVPIYDQRLPSNIANLSDAPWAERYALAIGVARVLKNPVDAIVRILEASDEFGRQKVMTLINQWPQSVHNAVDYAGPRSRKRGTAAKRGDVSRVGRERARTLC